MIVSVDADHLKAWLRLAPETEHWDLTPGEVVSALESASVALDDATAERIKHFVEQVTQQEQPPEEFLIAEGQPPVEGEHARFIWDESLEEPESDPDQEGQVDYRSLNMIRTVEKGAVIGKIVPPEPGTPGTDVHGNLLKPKKRLEPVKLQAHVALSEEDGESVIATESGRVVLESGKIGVREVLEISGDVDFESGNVDATSDVSIRGTVRDLFQVKSKKSMTINGAVEAAFVQAGGDVLVRGGILNRGKGKVIAKGKIAAKFCDEADLRADAGIVIAKEAINSRLHTTGKLTAERAGIIGGEVYARQGADVHTLGSEACVPTRVAVGIHLSLFKKSRKIDAETKKQQETVEKICQRVQPLLADVKRLSSEQKEQATGLLYQAQEIGTQIKAKQAQREEMLATGDSQEAPYVRVNGRICQKVVIIIDDRETHFQEETKGPVKIEKRKVDNVTEIVSVNQSTGSITTLNSAPCDLSQVPDEEEEADQTGPPPEEPPAEE